MIHKNRLIVYAPNVHVGGGLILLQDLLKAWPNDPDVQFYLDSRASDDLDVSLLDNIHWVKRTIFSRISYEYHLSKTTSKNNVVLSLNSLPLIFRTKAKQIVFMQNRNFIADISYIRFNPKQLLKIYLERLISYIFAHRVDQYIVQTQSLKQDLISWYPNKHYRMKPLIKVLPFITDSLSNITPYSQNKKKSIDFLYISDGLAHKNHSNLFKAWQVLYEQGFNPSLAVTIGENDKKKLSLIKELQTQGLNISNFGVLPYEAALNMYHDCKALIYPSLNESFGMPLLEATAAGTPIIASELDFVYDVCEPFTTFNPHSALSIARAVNRFLGNSRSLEKAQSPKTFINYIYSLL